MASSTSRAWFIVPAAIVLLIVVTVWSAKSGTATRALYEGKEDVVVSLGAPTGAGEQAARDLVDRFTSLGIDSQVLEADPQHVKLKLFRISEPKTLVPPVLAQEALVFQVISKDQSTHLADGGILPPEGGEFDGGVSLPGEHAHPWLIGLSRTQTLTRAEHTPHPPGVVPVLECIPGHEKKDPAQCASWLAGPPLPLTHRNIVSVKLGADKVTEEPLVKLMFDPEGAKVLEQVSREHPGQMLALVAFGELAARPEMNEPITTGGLSFSTRTGDTDRGVAVARADRLEAAARAKPLPPLTIESITVEPRK